MLEGLLAVAGGAAAARLLAACSNATEVPLARNRGSSAITPSEGGADGGADRGSNASASGADPDVADVRWEHLANDLEAAGVYSAAQPGKWAGKEGAYVPKVRVYASGVVTVSVDHAMTSGTTNGADGGAVTPAHYVTTVWVRDQGGEVIYLETFKATDVSPASIAFTVPAGTTLIFAYEHCNLHGAWRTEALRVAAR